MLSQDITELPIYKAISLTKGILFNKINDFKRFLRKRKKFIIFLSIKKIVCLVISSSRKNNRGKYLFNKIDDYLAHE